MSKLLLDLLVGAAIVYVVCCAALYAVQSRLLYFPTPEVNRSDAEKLRLKSDGVTINVWKLSSNKAHAVTYFGGNAEDVSHNLALFREILPDYDIYLMNYRGYGGSEGKPSEAALYSDALMLYDHLKDGYETVSVLGRSLGSGVATYVAARRKVARLALISPYDSIENIAREHYPIFPVSLLLRDKYDSAGRAHLISAPTLMLIAESDEVILRRRSEALAETFDGALLRKTIVPGTNHQTVSASPRFRKELAAFFDTA